MDNLWVAFILSIVEGLTEYLPVSSSGHLVLVGDLLNFSGEKAATFQVVIQLGAIMAVVVLYWERFWGLLRPQQGVPFAGLRGIWMLFLPCLPACVLGLLLHAQIKSLFTPGMVLIPFVIGALLMIFVERRQFHPRYETLDDMTPGLAFGIGCFQCLALFPGFPRSAATIMGGMILFHGLRRYVLGTCLLAVPGVAAFMWCVLMHDYQKQRVLTFLNPGDDPLGAGYHILQSRIAIGSGELWGKGYMEGMMNKLNFLPERHSDFALAVFGEEWGFVGCVALVTLFCLFLLSIFSTVVQAKDRFGSMLAVGVFFYFFWQICINMGMVIGLMPVVGIPLPFISYGGSATVVNFTLLGIVLNVSMRRFMFKS